MKQTILASLTFLASLLPNRVSHNIVKILLRNSRLIDLYGMYYITEIAPHLNITSVFVTGEYGSFAGTPNDRAILRTYARDGKWAASTNRAIGDFFNGREGTYIDIGANIGLTVIPISVHSNVICYAFEPDPTNFRNLKTNICANCSKDNIRAFNLALFDREAVLPFELSSDNLGDHRIRLGEGSPGRDAEDKRRVIEVPCMRLDDMNLSINGHLFVKIDTQGAEPFVISGGSATLAKADVILLEWAPYLMNRMGGDPAIILEFLQANFDTARIMSAESDGDEAEVLPIKEASAALSRTLGAWSSDPAKYVDVLVTRN